MTNHPDRRRLGIPSTHRLHQTITHRCGHRVRWTFFSDPVKSKADRDIARLAVCASCEATQTGAYIPPGGVDLVWPATGVCHLHDGACPDGPFIEWLSDVAARISGPRIIGPAPSAPRATAPAG